MTPFRLVLLSAVLLPVYTVNIDRFIEQIQLPKFSSNRLFPLLKFSFNSKVLTVIFADSVTSGASLAAQDMLKYNMDAKIVVVYKSCIDLTYVTESFVTKGYHNIVYICIDDRAVFTFESFPAIVFQKYQFRETYIPYFPNKIANIKGYPVKVALVQEIPKAMAYTSNGNQYYVGYMYRIIETFVQRIRGTMDSIIMEDQEAITKYRDHDYLKHNMADFMMRIYNMEAENYDWTGFLHVNQNVSDTLELSKHVVITPSPKEIDRGEYIFRPIQSLVWILLFTFLTVATSALYIPSRLLFGIADFSLLWMNLFRTITYQSFNMVYCRSSKTVTTFFFLVTVVGFTVTTFYSTYLGSFVTTPIVEHPLDTMDDIQKSGLKVVILEHSEEWYGFFFPMDKYGDVFVLENITSLSSKLDNFDTTFCYITTELRWKYFIKPQMDMMNRRPFRLSNIAVVDVAFYINLNPQSFYRSELNRFLQLIRDYGLYQYWTNNAYFEGLKYKITEKGILGVANNYFRPLNITFFEKLIIIWIILCGFAFFVFCGELLFVNF